MQIQCYEDILNEVIPSSAILWTICMLCGSLFSDHANAWQYIQDIAQSNEFNLRKEH